jgi:ectoine hydroxylase-related dioxygenase (phytanoyl-CoA dioxygenase family)
MNMSNVVEANVQVKSAPAGALSNVGELKQRFAEDGYVVFRNVVPRNKLAELAEKLARAFEDAKSSGKLMAGGGTISGHLNCFPGEPARFAYDAIEAAGVVALVKDLFPKATRMPNVGCNFNMPHSVAQHYHADRNFLDYFLIANVAVVDTTIENGAIDMIPGSHKKFYKYWRFALERASRGSTRIEMKQGDVLVRTSNVWHRGMPNFTDRPRPMLAFTWEDGGSTKADPFTQDEGRITFKQNWYRPTPLGRLRERTFVSAPITYHAYRFVTSLYGTKGYDHQ